MHRKRIATAVLLAATTIGAFVPAAAARPIDPVQRQLDLLVDADKVPGALAYDGRTTRTAGVADLESGRPMVDERGRIRVASNTKAFTAAAVMRLVADGRIRLDDRAGRYVPQLSEYRITIRQLLKQTSGLPEYATLVDWTRPGTPEDHLDLALKEKPGFEPGTGWGYSNTNYLALGMVIDKASGVGFRAYIERTILRPLHLDDTYWPTPGELSLRGPHARNYGVGRGPPRRRPRAGRPRATGSHNAIAAPADRA
ncbi:serine hydrolase domain-containing protein, partial [Streptomyces sp. NPDC059442]|uniref:serine hydrolase domain-containing protein n=1 Tax=Streptomyces sp. NPDC059442 TaxID=3346830 RepID=UPI0036AF7FDC